jgi:hypothetical protein
MRYRVTWNVEVDADDEGQARTAARQFLMDNEDEALSKVVALEEGSAPADVPWRCARATPSDGTIPTRWPACLASASWTRSSTVSRSRTRGAHHPRTSGGFSSRMSSCRASLAGARIRVDAPSPGVDVRLVVLVRKSAVAAA